MSNPTMRLAWSLLALLLAIPAAPPEARANECAASLVADARGSLAQLRGRLPDVRGLTKGGTRVDSLLDRAQTAAGADRVRAAKRALKAARGSLRSLRARLVKLGISGKVEGALVLDLVARADALVVRLAEIRSALASGQPVCTTSTVVMTTTTVVVTTTTVVVTTTTSSTATSSTSTTTLAPGSTSTTTSSSTTTTLVLNYSLPPNYGSTALTSGFVPDPFTVGITSGGPVSAAYLGGGCTGYATAAPDFSVNYTAGAFPTLRFYFIGSGDSTLIINAPSGSYSCNDDSFATLNPTIDFASPSSGRYDVWVGSFSPAVFISGTLYVTESTGNHP